MARQIREVMTERPASLKLTDSVSAAAAVMRDEGVGDVLVLEQDGSLCGIVTDRDIVIRTIAAGQDPATTAVGRICSGDVATLSPDDDEDRAIEIMRDHAIRRIPVLEGGRPVGVVSLGDLAIDRDRQSVLGHISAAPPNV